MKILIVGSGGREHALAWKISHDARVEKIFVAPGNGGTAKESKCENISVSYNDIEALRDFALSNRIDLTVVGPEEPLALGIADEFEKAGLALFGPGKEAARIESSKSFAKEVMVSAGIPTAAYAAFVDFEKAARYVREKGAPVVVKADGLAAGKGVRVAFTEDEAVEFLKNIFFDKVFGPSAAVVLEEFMEGEEATYLALTDGETVLPLSVSQDHKRIGDGDTGPNTGGMGAYSPAPVADKQKFDRVTEEIAYPLINELARRGVKYKGVIYAGLMINNDDIKVVEFNCRFGDPECQVTVDRLKSGFLNALLACAKGGLQNVSAENYEDFSVCVVLASGGYPGKYEKGFPITGLEKAEEDKKVKIFHGGTALEKGRLVTSGGRVLGVTTSGRSLKEAIEKAYAACGKINFENMVYRRDIGAKAFKR